MLANPGFYLVGLVSSDTVTCDCAGSCELFIWKEPQFVVPGLAVLSRKFLTENAPT